MLFSFELSFSRRAGAAAAARRRFVLSRMLLGALLLSEPGCAALGRRGMSAEKVAACRELSRQGVAAIEMGEWQHAEELLQKAIDASPNDAESRRHLAEALWHRGAAEEAMLQISEATRINPSDATLFVRSGEMLLAVGNTSEALERAEKAIGLDPKLASAWALRGCIFWREQHPDRALADLQRTLELAPQNAEVLLDVALMYRERGQPSRALTTLHHLLDSYPPGEEPQMALLLEGLTLLDLDRPHQATDSLLTAARRGPPNVEVQYRLAQAYSATGHFAEAATAAQQALVVNPSHAASRELAAQLASRNEFSEMQRR